METEAADRPDTNGGGHEPVTFVMANIHFSLAGEGRGHAARAKTVLEALSDRHRVTVHTFGDAYELLEPALERAGVAIRRIPGARFHYGRGGRVDLLRTARGNVDVLRAFPATLRRLQRTLEAEGADLVISDFEPLLPRAARRAGIPVLALDHQSVLAHGDFRRLPRALRRHATWMGRFVRAWSRHADIAVSSSFYRPRRRAGADHVRFVGVLLRESVRHAVPSDEGHLLAYVRRGTPRCVLDALASQKREVRVYGGQLDSPQGALRPRPVSTEGFAEDLRTCHAVVTSAGNQLVGEAIHLEKPVLAMPEAGNREQEINGWFLRDLGAGRVLEGKACDEAAIARFLDDVPRLARRCAQLDVDGTQEALHHVEVALSGAVLPAPAILGPSGLVPEGVQLAP